MYCTNFKCDRDDLWLAIRAWVAVRGSLQWVLRRRVFVKWKRGDECRVCRVGSNPVIYFSLYSVNLIPLSTIKENRQVWLQPYTPYNSSTSRQNMAFFLRTFSYPSTFMRSLNEVWVMVCLCPFSSHQLLKSS